jgi:hypothetical protein
LFGAHIARLTTADESTPMDGFRGTDLRRPIT